jgi:Uma2 family endonuclease
MVSPIQRVKLTYDDYLCLPEDGKCHEIIDGEHGVTPAPSTKHQRVSGHLFAASYTYIQETEAGQIFAAATDVLLSDVDIVQPDLLFISTPDCRSLPHSLSRDHLIW